MKRIVIAILVCAALAVGGSLAYAATDTSTPEKAAQACYEHHEFGAEPVDVAKTSDGAEVLAQVSWGANDYGWCYLVLDRQATKVLRDHVSGSLVYPTPAPEPTPSPAEQMIIDNYPDFYACAVTGSHDCQHLTPAPIQKFGNWQYSDGENTAGRYQSYYVIASSHSGYEWEDPPLLFLRCHVPQSKTGANNWMFITTPWLLHGADNTASVSYRFSGEDSATKGVWYSDDQLDSAVAPANAAQQAEFLRRLRATNGHLFVAFQSLWDGTVEETRFDVRGAADVLDELACF